MRFGLSIASSLLLLAVCSASLHGQAGSSAISPNPELAQVDDETPVESAGKPSDESDSSIKIRWLGHASFLITTSRGTTVLTDPIDFKGYHMPEGTTSDIVTVSHEHIDHNCVDAVSGSPVIFHGTDKSCRNVNSIDTTIGDIRLYTVPSFHGPGHFRSNAIFVFEFDGIRMAHMGDIGTILSDDQIAAIGDIDILILPVGGYFTIAGEEADTIASQVNVKRLVLPMHFKTEAFDDMPYTVEPFLKGKENVRRVEGNELVVDLTRSSPGREYVVFLSWDH